jgi:hypothetical protein
MTRPVRCREKLADLRKRTLCCTGCMIWLAWSRIGTSPASAHLKPVGGRRPRRRAWQLHCRARERAPVLAVPTALWPRPPPPRNSVRLSSLFSLSAGAGAACWRGCRLVATQLYSGYRAQRGGPAPRTLHRLGVAARPPPPLPSPLRGNRDVGNAVLVTARQTSMPRLASTMANIANLRTQLNKTQPTMGLGHAGRPWACCAPGGNAAPAGPS